MPGSSLRPLLHAVLLAGLAAVPALAQHGGHHPPPGGHGHSPYAGLEGRDIKALSPEEIDGLRAGRGMGLALAAELNGLPGPLHVLELADSLGLSAEQRARTQALFDRMKASAGALGERIVEAERHLDMRFRHRHIDAATLGRTTAEIAGLQGELRAVHLSAHLEMVEILQPAQIEAYVKARGYAGGHSPGHHGPMKH